MRLASLTPAALAALLSGAVSLNAGTDFTARNDRFQPGGAGIGVTVEKPSATGAARAVRPTPPRVKIVPALVGEKRFPHVTISPATAPTRPDVVHVTAQPLTLHSWNGQPARITTAGATRPISVERYQASMAAASELSLKRQPTVAPTRAVPLDRFAGEGDGSTPRDSHAVQRPAAAPGERQP